MQHKIITTENYILVVDDSEIKEGDYYLFTWGGEQDIQRFKDQESDRENHKYLYRTACKKIIAHLPKNSPILEGVDLLPPLEDEVEKLADEIVGDSIYYEEIELIYLMEWIYLCLVTTKPKRSISTQRRI